MGKPGRKVQAMRKDYFVYIMSSQRRVLYVGITSTLAQRFSSINSILWADSR
ncbi:MAG TPA: GIY-YIG nuclease family protein [Terriglobales bacterium]|nr:GIY-YIG nuclease family protein [Terriglobales bacterium]